jgi:hypothetical protein
LTKKNILGDVTTRRVKVECLNLGRSTDVRLFKTKSQPVECSNDNGNKLEMTLGLEEDDIEVVSMGQNFHVDRHV